MAQNPDLEQKVKALIDAGESDDDIEFFIKNYKSSDKPFGEAPQGDSTPTGTATATGAVLRAASKTPGVVATGLTQSPVARQIVGRTASVTPELMGTALGYAHGGSLEGAVGGVLGHVMKSQLRGNITDAEKAEDLLKAGSKGWDIARKAAALDNSSIIADTVEKGLPPTLHDLIDTTKAYIDKAGKVRRLNDVVNKTGDVVKSADAVIPRKDIPKYLITKYGSRYLDASGKLSPTFRILNRLAPAVKAVGTVGNALTLATGPTDIAQIAEPNRRDIGFGGLAFGEQPHVEGEKPALLNAIYDYISSKLSGK
jgi:hypothetical protein